MQHYLLLNASSAGKEGSLVPGASVHVHGSYKMRGIQYLCFFHDKLALKQFWFIYVVQEMLQLQVSPLHQMFNVATFLPVS